LLDIREAASYLILVHVRALADEFARLKLGAGRKTAVVTTADRFDNAHFFAVSARSMGFDVQAFSSLGDARDWLTS
jgi:hypothetical protein